MLKRFFLVLACISLLFVSPVFADELEVKQNLPVMDEESINSSLQKAGLKSVNLDPGYDRVVTSVAMWNLTNNSVANLNPLPVGRTAYGWYVSITCGSSDITQNNIVTFTLPTGYFDSYSDFVVFQGSCDDYKIDGNILTIYNPTDVTPGSSTPDLKGVIFANTPFTNNTDNPIEVGFSGTVGVISSGTELVDILKDQLSVSMVVEVLASSVAICIGFIFMWWGIRKTSGAIMSAFRRGKLRI